MAPDGSRWVPCRPNFFLPVRVLSRRFRRLFLDGLKSLYTQGQLTLLGRCRELAEPKPWRRLMAALREKEWVVYAKEPLPNPQHMLKYLARYVYRVAISNHRLVALENGQVTFRYKDHKHSHRLRTCMLEAVEFLHRLMLHVPPRGFQRVRYYGFLANRVRQRKLAQCRTLLGQAPLPRVPDEGAESKVDHATVGEPSSVCPHCHQGRMQLIETVCRRRTIWELSHPEEALDTS